MGNFRNLAFWAVLLVLVFSLFNLFNGGGAGTGMQNREISYSDFVTSVENGNVSNVTLDGEQVRFRQSDGSDYLTIKPTDAEVTKLLTDNDIPFRAESQQGQDADRKAWPRDV